MILEANQFLRIFVYLSAKVMQTEGRIKRTCSFLSGRDFDLLNDRVFREFPINLWGKSAAWDKIRRYLCDVKK